MLINEWKAQEHLFFPPFSLSPEEMERFDDKNSLKGGSFAISGAYIEVSQKKKQWWIIHTTSFELVYGSPTP